MIYSHSHADHFGGVRGLLGDTARDRAVPVIAPAGFVEEAASENVMAAAAIALLLRRRIAAPLYAVSLVGVLVQFG